MNTLPKKNKALMVILAVLSLLVGSPLLERVETFKVGSKEEQCIFTGMILPCADTYYDGKAIASSGTLRVIQYGFPITINRGTQLTLEDGQNIEPGSRLGERNRTIRLTIINGFYNFTFVVALYMIMKRVLNKRQPAKKAT